MMAIAARAQRSRPHLVEAVEPEIGWTPADRIAPGKYSAYCRAAKVYFDPNFNRWVCGVHFDVLDDLQTKRLARVPATKSLAFRLRCWTAPPQPRHVQHASAPLSNSLR